MMIDLPDDFIQTVISVRGEAGRQWLGSLDELITYCKGKWHFELLPAKKLSFNFVAPVVFEDGSTAILKLGLPGKGFQSEMVALAAYNGNSFCRLLDAEPEKGMMVLENIEPGEHLHIIHDDIAATTIAAGLIKDMIMFNPGSSYPFQTADDQYNDLIRLHKRFSNSQIPEYLFNHAVIAYRTIQSNPQQPRLLHGDLHQENILSVQNGGWKAIDPKGVISETGYELVPFLMNNLEGKDISATINQRIEIFSDLLRIDRERIVHWGMFRSVLSAYWQIEDNLPLKEQSLTVCDVFII